MLPALGHYVHGPEVGRPLALPMSVSRELANELH